MSDWAAADAPGRRDGGDTNDAPLQDYADHFNRIAAKRLAGAPADDHEDVVCAQEPIHLAAAIQPHGVLIALDPTASTIVCVSANAADLFGQPIDGLIDQPALRHLPPFAVTEAVAAVARPDAPRRSRLTLPSGPTVDCRAHAADGLAVLELERRPWSDGGDPDLSFNAVAQLSSAIAAADHSEGLRRVVCEELRDLLGFDRTLLLRFDADWTSEVVAESIADDWNQPLLGLHFPAGDIPAQARALYAAQRARALPDRSYVPVPLHPAILPGLGRPLDLSAARLRSQSAAHRAYLANLGVDSTLSASVLRHGRLWGLLMAHHRSAKTAPDAVVEALSHAMDLFSLRLEALEQSERDQARRVVSQQLDQLMERVNAARDPDDVLTALTQGPVTLADLFDAPTAAAVTLHDRWALVDAATQPPQTLLLALLNYARANSLEAIFTHDRLAAILPEAEAWSAVACGAVVAFLGPEREDALIWLRPESTRAIAWAGEPVKQIAEDGTITPRTDFSRWVEERRGWVSPTPAWRLELVESLRAGVDAWSAGQHRRLRQLNAMLETVNRAKSNFLASMSHELRTPLNAVIGFSDLLRLGVGGQLPEQSLAWVEQIDRAGRHLLSLVNDVLDFSKLEAGRYQIHPHWISPWTTLVESLQTVEAAAHLAQVTLAQPEGQDFELELFADDRALRQMLLNLFSNAIKYSPSGGMIAAGLSQDADGIRLWTTDQGPGMAPEMVARIGEPFLQTDAPSERLMEGSGLGLSIVKNLIDAHDGRLLVETLPEGGAKFTLWFPAAGVRRADAETSSSAEGV